MFKYETHCHTSESSHCGEIPAAETVELLIANGYSGVVYTDHFTSDYFKDTSQFPDWQSAVDYHRRGYLAAKEAAGDRLTVMYGMEIRFCSESDNDYLVFGWDEDVLRKAEGIYNIGIKKFHRFCEEHGMLVIQAHPFRNNMQILKPGTVDGIEVFNGHFNHDSRNDIAQYWATKYGLRRSSGSDAHMYDDYGHGGILTKEPLGGISDFVEVLRSGEYMLVGNGI